MLTEKREFCAELGQGEEEGGDLSADLGSVERHGPQALRLLVLQLHLHLSKRENEHTRSRYPAVLYMIDDR